MSRPRTNFDVTVSYHCDTWLVHLGGSLDLDTGEQLAEYGAVLGHLALAPVVLDLSMVDFIDTAGLQALARACAAIRQGGVEVAIADDAGPAVRRLLAALADCGVAAHIDGSRPAAMVS